MKAQTKETNKMKKLMIAAAIVCAAVVSQAAAIRWQGTLLGVDASAVGDNGNYTASGNFAGSMSYVLTIFSADGTTEIAKKTGTLTGSSISAIASSTSIKLSTEYAYKIVLSGTQSSLTSKTSPDYDYSAAKLSTTLTGTMTTNPSGTSPLQVVPTSWDVSGIVAAPEPTSGLLLLLGMAGLALKRKQK